MDPAGGMDLASAPPLPDGGPSPPAARGGPRRGGGGRGRGFRRGPHGAPHGVSPRSASMVRWQTLRRQIVTIGDDVCLVPTQLISLSQLVSDCIVAEREERQGGPSVAGHKQQKEGPSPTQQEGGVAPKVQNGVQQEQQQPGGPLPANSSSEAPAAAAAGGEESLGRSSKDNRGAAVDLDSKVISLIVECAARLPIKSGIYAALVGLLYRKARLRGWVSSLVTAAGARFESSLRQGLFTDAKLLLRFFFGLASSHVLSLVLSEFFGYWLNAWGGPSKLLDEWLGVAKAPPPTKLFVRLSLEKAMRINYPDALALSLPESAKDLSPPRAVADNPYLCLTPASANGAPQGAPSGSNDSAQEAAGGGGAGPSQGGGGPPLGLVEFSLLRQLLKFSFGSQDAKQANVLQVHKLLSSLVGQHKSKWTRPPQGGPQEAQAGALPSNDSEAAKARKEADADGASAEAAANAAGEAAAARGDEEAMEEEGSSTSPAHAIDWRALEQSERALESPPWDLAEVVRMLVICLLALGSKTQTHLHRLLSNYAPVFCLLEQQGAEGKAVVSDQQVDVHPAALQALQKYWANSQQKMALSLHAFIKVGILKRPNVLQLLCAASPEVRDSWAHLELIQTVLRGAIDDCETAKDEAEASGAPVPPAAEAEELLHTYLSCLLLDLKGEELRSRSRFLFLRCLFIGRKYAEYINLPRLQEEVGSGDPRLQSLWTIIAQVRRQFYFLDEEGALQ
ncbi:hypothetical protein Esti_005036 [Eimeria stiedai]